MAEHRYHDEMPAAGDWPGGTRYGYTVRREHMPRLWSDGDLERAHALGITLPRTDLQTYEQWYDQPADVRAVVDSSTLVWDETIIFIQRTVVAKCWRKITWSYRPPWDRHRG